jgi:glyoxylase-like metal-dependent hydrolase (beta-lactamase superfamily II)
MHITIGNRVWRAIISNGHAEGHLALYCEDSDLLISGDQILPTITSNISLFEDDPDLNPLQEYLDSLAVYRQLPESTLVLPSHGKIFRGLHARADAIRDAHLERSAQVHAICKEPCSVSGVAARLFPQRLDDINTCLAFGESFSHIRYLEKQQRLNQYSENGIILFRA